MFTYTLQVNVPSEYNKPKRFLSALEKYFDNEEDIALCLKVLAYLLSNNCSAKVIWFFVGKSNSGKSMLLRLITRIIGKEYVASVPLEKLNEKFALKSLEYCRANIVAEVSNLKLKESSTLKMITGGDQVTIEGKYETSYFSTLKLKFLLAGNHLPKLETTVTNDDGIKSRFRFLGFFKSLDEAERIDDYDKSLYEEEGNDIFYLLMRILKKLIEINYQFPETENSKRLVNEFFGRMKNVENMFIEECCIIKSSAIIAINDLYEAYKKFCADNGYTFLTRDKLVKYIQMLPSRPIKDRARREGCENAIAVIRGIELRRY